MDNTNMSELTADNGSAPSEEFMFTYLHQELWRSEQSIAQLRQNNSSVDGCVASFIEETGIESAAQFLNLPITQQRVLGNVVLKTYFRGQDEGRQLEACLESAQKSRQEIAALAASFSDKPLLIKTLPDRQAAIQVITGDPWDDCRWRGNIGQATATLADPGKLKSPILQSTDLITFRPASAFQRLRGIAYRTRLLNHDGDPLVSLSLTE